MNAKRRYLSAATATAVAASSLAGDAFAGSAPIDYGDFPDSAAHLVTNYTTAGYAHDGIEYGMTELDRSDLILSHSNTWEDVLSYIMDISPSAGVFHCDVHAGAPGWWCDKSVTWFDDGIPQNQSNQLYWKAVACHELGHSGGLGERSSSDTSSCLRNPASGSSLTFDNDDMLGFNGIRRDFPNPS